MSWVKFASTCRSFPDFISHSFSIQIPNFNSPFSHIIGRHPESSLSRYRLLLKSWMPILLIQLCFFFSSHWLQIRWANDVCVCNDGSLLRNDDFLAAINTSNPVGCSSIYACNIRSFAYFVRNIAVYWYTAESNEGALLEATNHVDIVHLQTKIIWQFIPFKFTRKIFTNLLVVCYTLFCSLTAAKVRTIVPSCAFFFARSIWFFPLIQQWHFGISWEIQYVGLKRIETCITYECEPKVGWI